MKSRQYISFASDAFAVSNKIEVFSDTVAREQNQRYFRFVPSQVSIFY